MRGVASGSVPGPAPSADITVCGSGHCITCADEATAMTVLKIDHDRGLALCRDDAGVQCTVETALVEPVAAGERLLVHAGTAIASAESPGDQVAT